MVQAWKLDETNLDPDLIEIDNNAKTLVDLEDLKNDTGVLYWQLNAETCNNDGSLESIKKERGYTYEDEIEVSPDKLPNFEVMLKKFASEHLHTDEEIRLILDGYGFFDVRNPKNDKWIRIEVVKGDLLILPAGIYHRLVLPPTKTYIKAKRLFIGEPVWTAHDRPGADVMDCRKKYLEVMTKG